MTQVTHSPVQDGSFVAGGWEESLDGLTLAFGPPAPSVAGLVFDWGLRFDSTGCPLDPPVIDTATLTLVTHASVLADPGSDVIEVWAVPEVAPADYTTVLAPFTRSEILVGSATYVWNGLGTTLSIPFNDDNWQTIRALYLSSTRWSGRLALSIQNQGAGGPFAFNSLESGTGPQLEASETLFFAGLIGGPYAPRQRFVRDQRFGMPALNTDLVRDNVVGMWVRPADQDPEDLPMQYRPKPGEGSVDDEIPTLD